MRLRAEKALSAWYLRTREAILRACLQQIILASQRRVGRCRREARRAKERKEALLGTKPDDGLVADQATTSAMPTGRTTTRQRSATSHGARRAISPIGTGVILVPDGQRDMTGLALLKTIPGQISERIMIDGKSVTEWELQQTCEFLQFLAGTYALAVPCKFSKCHDALAYMM